MNASPDIPELQTLYERVMDMPERERQAFLEGLAGDHPDTALELRRLLEVSETDEPLSPLIQFGDELLEPSINARAFDDEEEITTPIGLARIERLVSDPLRIGQTEVYAAVLKADQRRVALKILRSETSAGDLRRRFRIEALSHSKLDHPGVAMMLGAGAARGARGVTHPSIAFVFVDGVTLDEWAADKSIVPEIAQVIIEIARTIHYAHLRGIVHRDLKPRNIMVDSEGHPRLLDLGIAKLTDQGEVSAGQSLISVGETMVGTPRYMAPEQFTPTKQVVDLRADVYALGCILYELITGKPPVDVEGLSTVETADAKRHATVIEPRIAGVPRDLVRCAAHACAAVPSDRYESCHAFATDIERAINGLPLIERPPGASRRFYLLMHRHPRISALVFLVMLVILASAWTYADLQQRIASERDRAVARFHETRAFANWVIFDLDRLLSAMPATAAARYQLIDRASETLDALTADPQTDDDLLLEIIDARIRLGDVLSKELGDQPRGDQQFQEGLKLLDRLEAPLSPQAQVRRAWINLYRTYTLPMPYGTELEQINFDAISIFEQFEAELGGRAPYWRWRADAEWKGTRRLSDRQAPLGEILAMGRASISHADRALELDPSDPFNQSEAASTRFWLAYAMHEGGDSGAMNALQEAINAARVLADANHREGASLLARGMDLQGEMLASTGDYAAAITTLLGAARLHDAAVEHDPGNKYIFRRAEICQARIALTYLESAGTGFPMAAEQGLKHIRSAIDHLNHRIALGWFDELEGDYRGEYADIERRLLDLLSIPAEDTP